MITQEAVILYLADNGVTVTPNNVDQFFRLRPDGFKRWYVGNVSLPDEATLAPYESIAESVRVPSDEERIDQAFPKTDTARVIFEALFELANRIAELENKAPYTRQQLRSWLINKLPN